MTTLALDEHRWTFEPRLYEAPGDVDDLVAGRTLRQRWFPGAHRDVGGGFAPEGAVLAEATLVWMTGEAIACGLGIPPRQPCAAAPGAALDRDALGAARAPALMMITSSSRCVDRGMLASQGC